MRQWFALMCSESSGFKNGRRVFGEFAAVERVRKEKFAAFTPCRRVLDVPRRHGANRRRSDFLAPLFPGYAFAEFDDSVWQRQRLRAWPEVFDVVRLAGEPHPIPLQVIQAVRQVQTAFERGDTTGDPVGVLEALLRVGDQVELRDVSWAGHQGTLEAIKGQRLVVLLSLFGVPTRVETDRANVAVAPQ